MKITLRFNPKFAKYVIVFAAISISFACFVYVLLLIPCCHIPLSRGRSYCQLFLSFIAFSGIRIISLIDPPKMDLDRF